MKWLVSVPQRHVHVGVMRNHSAGGGDDLLGALLIARLRFALEGYLHVIPDLH
jgi:hypothetical protein